MDCSAIFFHHLIHHTFLFVPHSVMFLQFVPKTHLFFTAGKDRKIKQWDADKFEHIQTLEVIHFNSQRANISTLFKWLISDLLLWVIIGSPSGSVVSNHQPERGPYCVVLSRQVPAAVGEDQGAHHPGGGAGDGSNHNFHCKNISHFKTYLKILP